MLALSDRSAQRFIGLAVAFAAAAAAALAPTTVRAQPAAPAAPEAAPPAGATVYVEADSTRPDTSLFRLTHTRRGQVPCGQRKTVGGLIHEGRDDVLDSTRG